MSVQEMPISQIKPNARNSRTHSAKQIRQIVDSIIAFGFASPLLVSEDLEVIAGHGRYLAAMQLGLEKVPVVVIAGLSPARRRALAIADNRIAQSAGWNRDRLAIEIPELADLLSAEGLDISVLGFEPVEIDHLQTKFEAPAADPRDTIDPKWGEALAVSKLGDLWVLGDHVLLCGDARCTEDMARLMTGRRADLAFIDLACGQMTGHFGMASGETSAPNLVHFLSTTLAGAASVSREGAVHFVCMDRRDIAELLAAANPIYGKAIDLAVWVRPEAGNGSLYRNQHELIGVFGVGKVPRPDIAPRRRSRSNVWRHAPVTGPGGIDGFHRTAKPVALVADAIEDCTHEGDVVLDTFAGLGTTMIAAERVGRHARALEVEPRLVDAVIRRWQALTHRDAIHAESGSSFDDIAAARSTPAHGDQGERQ